jgi:hypothetical protein
MQNALCPALSNLFQRVLGNSAQTAVIQLVTIEKREGAKTLDAALFLR